MRLPPPALTDGERVPIVHVCMCVCVCLCVDERDRLFSRFGIKELFIDLYGDRALIAGPRGRGIG